MVPLEGAFMCWTNTYGTPRRGVYVLDQHLWYPFKDSGSIRAGRLVSSELRTFLVHLCTDISASLLASQQVC